MGGWTAPKDVILYVAGAADRLRRDQRHRRIYRPRRAHDQRHRQGDDHQHGRRARRHDLDLPGRRAHGEVPARDRARRSGAADASRTSICSNRTRRSRPIPAKYYDRVVELDLSKLEPYVVGPHSPDRARPISKLAAEVADPKNGFVDEISTALIGSCTNSSYEDMSRAADVAEQAKAHGLKAAVPFLVTPGSEQVRATIERDGQMQSLKDIDGTVLANACGPCIGQWRRADAADAVPNTIVTSYNRNFPRRNDGQPTTMNFIGSPEIVTALALGGRLSFNPLTDTLTGADGKPFRLEPPKPAPEVPAHGFDRGHATYIAPPEDGSAHRAEGRSEQRAAAADGAVAGVGRQGLRGHAGADQDQGQDHDRPHLARRSLAALPRPSRQVQRQHVHGRDQRLHRRGRQGHKRPDRREGAGDRQDRPRLQGPRRSSGSSSATTTTARAAAASTPRCRRACWAARRSSRAALRASTSPT